MPPSSARAERLVNLVLCLLSTRQFLTAERIRSTVAGYEEAPTDEAFFRTFERDKADAPAAATRPVPAASGVPTIRRAGPVRGVDGLSFGV